MTAVRIGIIGNSHIVALKNGWALAQSDASGYDPVYFATPGDMFQDFHAEGANLVPNASSRAEQFIARSSDGATKIETEKFNAFVLVGLHLNMLPVVKLYETHRLPQHAERRHFVISRAALERATLGILQRTSAFHILGLLRTTTRAPILLTPEPLPSISFLRLRNRDWDGQYLSTLYEIYCDTVEQIASTFGATLCLQPEATICAPCCTYDRYTVNSMHLLSGKPHRSDEGLHMNAAFGAEAWRSMLPIMQAGLAHTGDASFVQT